MDPAKMISHEGIVVNVDKKRVKVRIISMSACSSCHAKGTCTAADMSEKFIDAYSDRVLSEGERVRVILEEKLGWVALFYGILIPFFILITVLFALSIAGKSESFSALSALISLVPYYIALHFFSGKIEKKFQFKAERSAINFT